MRRILSKEPKIFYFAYGRNRTPHGGIKQIYRHVDILNRAGFSAYVLHTKKGFRATWFNNHTRVTDLDHLPRLYDPRNDIFVCPEDLRQRMLDLPGRKVIFDQNIFYGLAGVFNGRGKRYPVNHSDVIGVLSVSRHNAKILRFAFPAAKIIRVYCGIDPTIFSFRELREKRRQVAFSPKCPLQHYTLYNVLRARSLSGHNRLKDWEWVFIENKTELEVARILRRSFLFVSLSVEEGFSLMPLEAMASGCLVVGPKCAGPSEYLPPKGQFSPGEIVAAAKHIESAAAAGPAELRDLQRSAKAARAIALRYSLEREAKSVIAAWSRLLSSEK